MAFGADADAYADQGGLAGIESSEPRGSGRRWAPTLAEAKLLLIASTGFFIDAYDLFTINLIVPILNVQYNHKNGGSLLHAPLKGGLLKAAANLGCVVGQIGFGILGDIFGRRRIYPLGLCVAMFGVIMTIAAPPQLNGSQTFTWITVWRVVMGIGIGGDYPMSASVVSDRANLNRRGLMLSFIFSMQGWGNFVGGIVSIVVLSCFRSSIFVHGKVGHFNAVWRIIIGLILIPCMGTLYQRIMLPESARMKAALALRNDPTLLHKSQHSDDVVDHKKVHGSDDGEYSGEKTNGAHGTDVGPGAGAPAAEEDGLGTKGVVAARASAWREFIEYFSEWRHAKHLIGTAGCWFLVDITFYGISLNQSIVISAIGYNKATNPWQNVFDNTKANLIITAAGFLPGYYATMLTIEYIGRKPIQIGGFLMEALFLGIVGGDFNSLKTKPAAFIVCFAFLQFFFNFGANATTFIYPAEVFPTRLRGFAHGFSAACGKCGAVLASLGFAIWAADIGTDKVLWIFFGISILGALCGLLLPETKGYDADMIDLKERREKHARLNQ